MGLMLVGVGYLFMVWAAFQTTDGAKAAMWLVAATYFVHTMGEIILSPTGLSYVTKAAPKNSVSLLMGIWFVSSFIANLGAGKVAAMVEPIMEGEKNLPWRLQGGEPGTANTEADFFFLFVVTSCSAGLLILILGPLLKKLTGGRE
jgi:POT family proton-dependent oligopeptide transporter